MLERSDKLYIARIGQQVITAVLHVGLSVVLYFVALELVAYYQPTTEWLRRLPGAVALGGGIGLVIRAWEHASAVKRLEKSMNDD